jgi:SAM-dependent methyltransferase
MQQHVEKFYNEKVKKDAIQKGFLGILYYKFKKFEKNRYDSIAELVRDEYFENILDTGCYNGKLLEKIGKNARYKNLFGIDINKKGISDCKNKFPNFKENFSLQNIDDGSNFSDEKFDLITMAAVLEHTFDPIFVIEEIHRILKPGGTFIVEVPNITFIRHRVNLLFGKRPRTSWDYGWDGGHLQYFNEKDLKILLRKNGFQITKVTGSGIFRKFRTWWPSLLLSDILIVAKKA